MTCIRLLANKKTMLSSCFNQAKAYQKTCSDRAHAPAGFPMLRACGASRKAGQGF